MRSILLLLFSALLFAADFDVALIGSSPFSLFEALYQSHMGKSVVILEEAAEWGGAWKSIYICGIPNVDLGCHQIGRDLKLKNFLEEYAGCKIVSHDNPHTPLDGAPAGINGFYFSKGCYELINNLLQLIAATPIVLHNNYKVESLCADTAQGEVVLHTKQKMIRAKKVIVTPMCCVGFGATATTEGLPKSKYYHIYFLVQDPTPPRFSYHGTIGAGVSRVMNLTHFVGLTGTGRHLIVAQVHGDAALKNWGAIVSALKEKKLIDPAAYILEMEPYIYETGSFQQNLIPQIGAQEMIEVLQTGHLSNLVNYITKWKSALKPFDQVVRNSLN